jgi:hypothetical protein
VGRFGLLKCNGVNPRCKVATELRIHTPAQKASGYARSSIWAEPLATALRIATLLDPTPPWSLHAQHGTAIPLERSLPRRNFAYRLLEQPQTSRGCPPARGKIGGGDAPPTHLQPLEWARQVAAVASKAELLSQSVPQPIVAGMNPTGSARECVITEAIQGVRSNHHKQHELE